MNDSPPSSLDFYRDAKKLMEEKSYSKAVELFKKSLEHRIHFKCLELMGECYIKLEKPHDAIVPLAAASMLNSGVRAAALLAHAFFLQTDHGNAMRAAKQALLRDPNNRMALKIMESLVGDQEQESNI